MISKFGLFKEDGYDAVRNCERYSCKRSYLFTFSHNYPIEVPEEIEEAELFQEVLIRESEHLTPEELKDTDFMKIYLYNLLDIGADDSPFKLANREVRTADCDVLWLLAHEITSCSVGYIRE